MIAISGSPARYRSRSPAMCGAPAAPCFSWRSRTCPIRRADRLGPCASNGHLCRLACRPMQSIPADTIVFSTPDPPALHSRRLAVTPGTRDSRRRGCQVKKWSSVSRRQTTNVIPHARDVSVMLGWDLRKKATKVMSRVTPSMLIAGHITLQSNKIYHMYFLP